MAENLTFGIKLKADGTGFTGEIKMARAALDGLAKTAEAAAESASQQFGKTRAGVRSISEKLSELENIAKGGVGLYAISEALKATVVASTLAAARYETMGAVMKAVGSNAGYGAGQMADYAEGVRKMGITMLESRESVVKMAQANIDLGQSQKLARIAQDAAVIGGVNSSEALKQLVYGIQSAQVDVLRTIGINVNFEESYKKLARSIGKTTEDLTEQEKVQARVNAVTESGANIAGTYEAAMGTAGKQMSSLARYSEDAKVKMGEVFQESLLLAIGAYTGHLKETNQNLDELAQKDLKKWGDNAAASLAFAADSARSSATAFQAVGKALAGYSALGNMAASGNVAGFRAVLAAMAEDSRDLAASTSATRDALDEQRKRKEQDDRTIYAPGATPGSKPVVAYQFPDAAAKKSFEDSEAFIKGAANDLRRARDSANDELGQMVKTFATNHQKMELEIRKVQNLAKTASAEYQDQVPGLIAQIRQKYGGEDAALIRARSDALIKQAEGGSKRATEFYKQELEQNRLAFADYVGAVEALQRNALTAKRGALASTLAGAVQPGDKERIKGQLEEIDRELADLPNKSSRSLEDYSEKWRERMRGIAAELSGTMSAADKARGEFVSRHTADIARAAAEGDAAALEVLGAVARRTVAKGEFADAANEYKGMLNGVAAEIEAIKARAASGDLDAASALAGEKAIRDRAIPALDALIARLAELKAAASDPAVAAQFGEMAKGFEQAKIAAQDAHFDDFWAGAKRGANDYLATSANVAKSSRDFFSRSFKSMEDAVTQFAMTGKLNLRDFANVAIQEFYRINLARPLVGALSGAFQGAAGSFGSLFSTSQTYGTSLFSQQTSMLAAQTAGMHSGGIVGQDATFNRHISPAHFDGAPRFHTGGIIGPGERPIIAQDGEEVLTRSDPRHRYNQRNAQAPETSGAVTLVYSPNIQIDARNAAPGMEQVIARVVNQAVEQSRASLMAEIGSGGQFALATGRRRR